MIFIDEANIEVRAGDGGDGCIAFRREKFVPRGGPSGGDGGQGGSVVLVANPDLNTLHHLRFPGKLRAERGRHGEGSNRTGKSGEDLLIEVPLGTVVHDGDEDNGLAMGEILEEGARLVVAQGGRGGRGNASYATSTRQAPRYAQPGTPGEERRLRLELKLLADVGVVGLPNAGKSTFISVVTAAKPKVADYPFTTLVPQLGVVAPEDFDLEDPFVIADLPGLIAGAAEGAGLGHRFLRHVERCRVLLHLVDLSGLDPKSRIEDDVETIEKELGSFSEELLTRSRILVGSKLDSADPERRAALAAFAKLRGLDYFEMSSVTGLGLSKILHRLVEELEQTKPLPLEHEELGESASWVDEGGQPSGDTLGGTPGARQPWDEDWI